jgi:hypothetical protein
MAKKPKQQPADDNAMGGFPQDKDPYVDDQSEIVEQQEPPAPVVQAKPDPELMARLDRVERENQELRRMIPPARPKEPSDDPEAPIDWEKEIFQNPNSALEKFGNQLQEKITKDLTSKYQREQGTTQFWNKFYQLNPDLQQDSDLVELTLNSNLADLSNIRVEDAYGKLAELTRERILRYAGGAAKGKRKAQVESGGPSGKETEVEPPASQGNGSLSQILKKRRMQRRGMTA